MAWVAVLLALSSALLGEAGSAGSTTTLHGNNGMCRWICCYFGLLVASFALVTGLLRDESSQVVNRVGQLEENTLRYRRLIIVSWPDI